MRRIIKKEELPTLESFKKEFVKNNGKEARYRDLATSPKQYNEVKSELIEEQYGICCYCMKRIRQDNSHIEHIVPRSDKENGTQLEMDYQNMVASCNGFKENRENCGHKKDNWYSKYLMISPLEAICEEVFDFTIDGHIKSEDRRGDTTIKKLDLDNYLLVRARKSAIYISEIFDDDFEEKKEELIREFSEPFNGELSQFCNAVLYCIRKL